MSWDLFNKLIMVLRELEICLEDIVLVLYGIVKTPLQPLIQYLKVQTNPIMDVSLNKVLVVGDQY